jgi:hypothetical protein
MGMKNLKCAFKVSASLLMIPVYWTVLVFSFIFWCCFGYSICGALNASGCLQDKVHWDPYDSTKWLDFLIARWRNW